MTVEPITVWTAFVTFVFGMLAGVLIAHGEFKRARRRWREATRTWHEIEAVAVDYRDTMRPIWWQRKSSLKHGAHSFPFRLLPAIRRA
jgi:hypothetical protein